MAQLSLCMPTNRNFASSRAAIEGALAFSESRDAVLVISDNSGDPEKENHWRDRSPRIRYSKASGTTAFENFLATIRAADTPFVLQVGDDDAIAFDPSVPAVDLASLPPDFIGVRPKTEVTVTGAGVVRLKEFGIDAETPSMRIREYSQKAGGDNSGFYSIYRREPYLGLISLFAEHHPIRGNFTDWAMAMALFAYGRMAYDPGIIYRYNADQWSTPQKIERKNQELYAAVGLPPDTKDFMPLLTTLDLFVFLARPGTPLDRPQAMDAVGIVCGDILNGFLNQVIRKPEDYSEKMRYLVEMAGKESNALDRFHLALVMVDELKPGLKDAYLAYFKTAQAHGA